MVSDALTSSRPSGEFRFLTFSVIKILDEKAAIIFLGSRWIMLIYLVFSGSVLTGLDFLLHKAKFTLLGEIASFL